MAKSSGQTLISISEAVLLGHAMVQRVADGLGVRAFFIKGPASVIQRLRQPRTSADVDVFVPPSDLESMLHALRDRGWQERPVDPDSKSFPRHSVTVDHPEWPCCIDVHFRFPGMEHPAKDCFEVMWSETVTLQLAGQELRVPSEPLGILVLALHALRSPQLADCRQELEFLSDLATRLSYAAAVKDLAVATGSLAAVRPFLEELLENGTAQPWPQPSREWRNRLTAIEPGSARLIAILQAPAHEKVQLLWKALIPSRDVFLSRDIYADVTFKGRLLLHWARWRRFLLALPRTARDIRKL